MLPNDASIANYGGSLQDYSAVRDASRDRAAAGVNPAFGDTAAMTKTSPRVWVRFRPNGTGAPTLAPSNAHGEHWNNGLNVPPVLARTAVGIYTVTYPATVFDEIPAGLPGANPAGTAVNLRAAWDNVELGSTTNYDVKVSATTANVLTAKIFTIGTSTLVDPNDATIVSLFAI